MNYKKLIVDSGKRMAGSGLTVETWGNISVRDPETGLVYLTPSAMLYDTIVEDDVVVCTLDGKIVEGTRKPTIETEMHLSVYRNRAEVNAVIHTHPLYSMVYAAQGKDIPLIIDEAAQIMGDVCRCTEYACLIHSHGAVCVGENMEGAFKVAKVLEVTSQIYYMIEATGGKPVGISDENIAAMQDFVKNSYGQGK